MSITGDLVGNYSASDKKIKSKFCFSQIQSSPEKNCISLKIRRGGGLMFKTHSRWGVVETYLEMFKGTLRFG